MGADMWRFLTVTVVLAILVLSIPSLALAQSNPTTIPSAASTPDMSSSNPIFTEAVPSLVAVRFTFNSDFGSTILSARASWFGPMAWS